MPEPQISRRVLLGATAAALLAGCDAEPATTPRSPQITDGDPDPAVGGTGGTAGSEVSGDDLLVANAVAGARELVGAYASLVARHRATRRATAPLRSHLREHLTALGDGERPARGAPAVRNRKRAVQAVLTAERAASAARIEDAVAAASGDLARVLASIGASHAQHAVVLEGL